MQNYWLFQASPKEDDLRIFLRRRRPGDCFTWRATLFRDPNGKMFAGDEVAMWQTRGRAPEAAGIYALGRLTGRILKVSGVWDAEVVLDQIAPPERPLPPDVLRGDPDLSSLLVLRPKGFMGSLFRLSSDQWCAILSLWNSYEPSTLNRAVIEKPPKIRMSEVEGYFSELARVSTKEYEMRQPERKLVTSYVQYSAHLGHKFKVARIDFADDAGELRCDLYDFARKVLIEAKGEATRVHVRMAIGELADYARFLDVRDYAVLLPHRPTRDLEKLLQSKQIGIVWRNSDQSFGDNVKGRLS